MFNVQIDNTQQVVVTLAPLTDQGKTVDPTPVPVWSQEAGGTDPATVIPSGDGFSATLVSSATPGDTVFLVSATVGGVAVSAEITLTVVSAAVLGALVFSAGAPSPKAAAARK